MINVVKFYKPLQLDPGETGSWTVEDEVTTVKFVFNPLLRVYAPYTGVDDINLKITHIFDLGFGDDPLWSGTQSYVVVNEDLPPASFRDYTFTPQIDRAETLVTRHTVEIKNLSATEQVIVKSLLFGLTETQVQISKDLGVITTQQPI